MRIHLVRYSTSARFEKYSIIHLVRPIIHLVRIFALSTSIKWIIHLLRNSLNATFSKPQK